MLLLAAPASGQRRLLHEHRGLVAEVDELSRLSEVELEAQHHALRADAGPRLAALEFERGADAREALEVGAVDAVAESRPARVEVASTACGRPRTSASPRRSKRW